MTKRKKGEESGSELNVGGNLEAKDSQIAGHDIIGGDKITIERYINIVFHQASPIQLDDQPLQQLRDDYFAFLHDSYRMLDFKGIRLTDSLEKTAGLQLTDVYVPVRARPDVPEGETWQRIAGRHWKGDAAADDDEVIDPRAEPIDLQTVLTGHPAIVVLGDPGAGKSTLVKHLALSLTRSDSKVLPIPVPLNAYSKALQENRFLSLLDFLPVYFGSQRSQLKHSDVLFRSALEQQRAVILLDGLDEVVVERGRVVELVDQFVREHLPQPDIKKGLAAGNRVITTSRFVGYREAPLKDQRWHTVALVDWERDEINEFVSGFTEAVETLVAGSNSEQAQQQALAEKTELIAAIERHPGIERLAGNPLLLTILILIKRQGVTLPDRRAELYELYLETMLRSWNKARALDRSPVGPEIDYLEVWNILAPMALWLRETNPQAGLVTEHQLNDFLVSHFHTEEGYNVGEARAKTREFLDSVHKYSSLLLERGQNQFGFIHQTLEEYLAGCGLTRLPHTEVIGKFLEHIDEPHWHETLLLGIGALGIVRKDQRNAGLLLEALIETKVSEACNYSNIILAGEALRDVGQVGVGKRAAQRVKDALEATMQGKEVDVHQRRDAGFILGDIGWQPDDLDEFIEIKPTEFPYGDDKEKRVIEHPYRIGKYPVTNLQFARFVDAGGYREQRFWDDESWKWLQNEEISEPGYWQDRKWNNPLAPVVVVSWYEACAYCRWLSEAMSQDGYLAQLPSEEQWELAARGEDGREYPWGDEFEECRANTSGDDYGRNPGTTAVCAYLQGESPYAIWDMGGNVWEWTISLGRNDDKRVVRGGSWSVHSRGSRCACRDNILARANRSNILGFRVVLSLASDC